MALAKVLKRHNKHKKVKVKSKIKPTAKPKVKLPFKVAPLLKKAKGNGLSPSFSAIIDYYLRTRKEFKSFKMYLSRNKLVGFHPSEITSSTVCVRYMAYRYLLEAKMFDKDNTIIEDLYEYKTYPPGLQRTWDTGHLIHGIIQYSYLPDYYGKEGLGEIYDVEVPVTDLFTEFMIGGTSDIWAFLQDGLKRVIDIKTIKGLLFSKLKGVENVSAGYIGQASLYSYGLHIPEDPMIFFWNKDNGELKEFTFPINMDMVKHALLASYHAKNYLHGKSFPQMIPECAKGGKRFETCDFSSVCSMCNKKEDILEMCTVDSFEEIEDFHLNAVKNLGATSGKNKKKTGVKIKGRS